MTKVRDKIENVVLLTVDCLRADHLGCYGYPRNVSPFIDSLASKGAKFLNAISHGGGTPEAFPSILASVYPPIHPNQYTQLYKRSLSLPEVLKEKGYETAAFHSNPYLSQFFHYHTGFDVFEDNMGRVGWSFRFRRSLVKICCKFPRAILKLAAPGSITDPPTIKAEEMTRKIIPWVTSKSGNFFLWAHYMDVHSPRIPPSKYLAQFCSKPVNRYDIPYLYNKLHEHPNKLSTSDQKTLIDLYDASVKYVDDNIYLLLSKLSRELSNTVFVITADHGEALGEHGVFGHDQNTLYDEIIRVPLIITGPTIKEGSVVKGQVSLMGIAPTIIDLLMIPPVKDFCGASLIPAIKGNKRRATGTISVTFKPTLGRRAICYRTEQYKYIRTEMMSSGEVIREEFYDLTRDPCEITNLMEVDKKKAQAFESKLVRYISCVKDNRTAYEKKRVKEKLRSSARLLGKLHVP